jgi:hypothetical protein
LTTFEISEIYNVDKNIICDKLKEFQIDSNPSDRKYRLLKATPLTREQIEFIIGSTLGKGSIMISGRKNAYFKVVHYEKDYLLWKKSILGNLTNNIATGRDKREKVTYEFHTMSHQELNKYRKMFYENNRKVIKDIGDYLTAFGLAIWFMDSGSRINNCTYRLSTGIFDGEDNKKLQVILKTNFNLSCKVCEYERHGKKYYYISFNKENTLRMTEIIRPYIIECMKNKLIDCSPTTTCEARDENHDDDIV